MKLIALVIEPKGIVRDLTKLGEPTDVHSRSTSLLTEGALSAAQGLGLETCGRTLNWAWAGAKRFAHTWFYAPNPRD